MSMSSMKYSLTFSESTGEVGVAGSTAGLKGFSSASIIASTSRSDSASSCSLELKLEPIPNARLRRNYLNRSFDKVGVDPFDGTFADLDASVADKAIKLKKESFCALLYPLTAPLDQVF